MTAPAEETLPKQPEPESGRPWRTWLGYGVIGVFVAVCAAGWAVIVGHAGDSDTGLKGIAGRTVSFTVQSDTSVQLTFQILKPTDARVTCVARAQAKDGLVVGQQEVVAQPGKSTSTQMIYLPTTARATTAEVRDCALS